MNRLIRKPRKQEPATSFQPIQDETLQRGTVIPQQVVDEVPPIVQNVLSSSGQPLDADTQVLMESRFGHDFSKVRVHTDERAVESAQEVNALAYTVGRDVVFGESQYAPETNKGQGLIAHELTHVVQQNNTYAPIVSGHITPANHPSEQQANAMSLGIPTSLDAPPNGISLQRRGQPHDTVTVDPQTGVTKIEFLEGETIIAGEPDEDNIRTEIANALGSIKVASRTKTELLFHPWEIFQLLPQNPRNKREVYAALKDTQKKLSVAENAARNAAGDPSKAKELTVAQAMFEQALQNLKSYIKKHVLSSDNELKKLAKQKKSLQRSLASLYKRKAAQNELDKVQNELKGIEKAEQNRQETMSRVIEEAPEAPYEPVETERTYYTVTIEGATISLYNHADAYCTVFERGLYLQRITGPRKGATVDELLAKDTTMSESRKKILKTISRFEGSFASVNTYDIKDLTWGMLQFAGGERSELTKALTFIKKMDAEAFKRRFQKYGIDVDNNQLVITPVAGREIRGGAAAKAVQASPVLTAVMAAAGLDPDIQLGELKAANALMTGALHKMLNVKAPEVKGGKEQISAVDIFTSEYGVGVLTNRTVHAGFPMSDLQDALATFVKKRGFQPIDHQWVADAEQTLIPAIARDPKREVALKKACKLESGSFIE